jgi:ribonucleoside-triphosphate reductase (thioredoxin)
LAGTTPGVHFPESTYYIRRIRLSNNSDLLPPLREAGYFIEPAFGSEDSTVVVEFPVFVNHGTKTLQDGVSMWEQLSLAALMQEVWADNQVSCTVTFAPEEADQIASALDYFQYKLKGISFLPRTEEGAYPQMPYEAITKERYEEMIANIKPVQFGEQVEDSIGEKYCTTDVCLV